jgi:hypothetical protein
VYALREQVKVYRAQRLNLRATLERDSYGFGDTASAVLTVIRAQGDTPVGADVALTLRVDGQEVYCSAPADVQKVPIYLAVMVTAAAAAVTVAVTVAQLY